MNILAQESKKRQAVVECEIKNDNKSYAGRKYGYSRSFSGMVYAAKRLGLGKENKKKKPAGKHSKVLKNADKRIPVK